ncbi:MAG: hypothetical protein J6J17_01890 [Bacilli bacterium]|nr:hypothetical protein [Bacilli bacterium]
MKITIKELNDVKNEIFNKYIADKEKDDIAKLVNDEVKKILGDFEESKDKEFIIDE